jgi:hypothetical protein
MMCTEDPTQISSYISQYSPMTNDVQRGIEEQAEDSARRGSSLKMTAAVAVPAWRVGHNDAVLAVQDSIPCLTPTSMPACASSDALPSWQRLQNTKLMPVLAHGKPIWKGLPQVCTHSGMNFDSRSLHKVKGIFSSKGIVCRAHFSARRKAQDSSLEGHVLVYT